ncbi:unnamed protein product [Victoria cruziana]
MEKSRQPGETRKLARFHPDDEGRKLISYLRKKLQDPEGLHSANGDLIPTVDIFNADPDTFIRVMTPEQKVWYFFSPMETPGRSRSVGDGFWRESSAKEDIVNEQGHKIGERRSRCCRNWTMQEYRLLDSQHAELHNYVLCKIYEEAAAKKQEEDESTVKGGIRDEASAAGSQRVHGHSNFSSYIPPDDRLYWNDPAEYYDGEAPAVTEPSPAGQGRISSIDMTAALRPREPIGPYTPSRAAPARRRIDSALALPELKEHQLLMKLPFEPLPWLGRPPTKRKVRRRLTRVDAQGKGGRNPGSQNDLVGLEAAPGSSSAESSPSIRTER